MAIIGLGPQVRLEFEMSQSSFESSPLSKLRYTFNRQPRPLSALGLIIGGDMPVNWPENIVSLLKYFVRLQVKLISAISELPPKAEKTVTIDAEQWTVRQHGEGFEFRNQQSNLIVDAHRFVECPNVFDAWRIDSFMRSLPTGLRRRYRRQLGGTSVNEYLQKLEHDGVLSQTLPTAFRFAELPEDSN